MMELSETERVIVNALHLEGNGVEKIAAMVKKWRTHHIDLGVYYVVAQEIIAEREVREKRCADCPLNKAEKKELLERLAALEHEQWIAWSKSITYNEHISQDRFDRWRRLWCPYSELTGVMKDQDRRWARKVITIVKDIRGK